MALPKASSSLGRLSSAGAPATSIISPTVHDSHLTQKASFEARTADNWIVPAGGDNFMEYYTPEIAHFLRDFATLIADLEEYVRQSSVRA